MILKKFMDEDFLLSNETAKKLFKSCNAKPIFDYHCHLPVREICEDKRYKNIAEIWLGADHYKWRVMRACGVDEKLITGSGDDRQKFDAWASVLPYCIGNPLYHWTHLELRRYFGIDEVLSPKTADAIWEKANAVLQSPDFSARGIILKSNVKALCTTDDPADSLEYHRRLAEDKAFPVKVLPAFRPDAALHPQKAGFGQWVSRLSEAAGVDTGTFAGLKNALSARIRCFASLGCVASDHSLPHIPFGSLDESKADAAYRKALRGLPLSAEETEDYRTALLFHLASEYKAHGMVMELHIGALRNNSAKMFGLLGPDAGFDSIGDEPLAAKASAFFSRLEEEKILPKTVLYALNPKDYPVLITMAGNFNAKGVEMQFGSAWWFNDHIGGMVKQMRDVAEQGVLGKFIGMVTDSRSFLSYPRHEYFRRVLCNLLGEIVENGEYPADYDTLSSLANGIAYENAVKYFGI